MCKTRPFWALGHVLRVAVGSLVAPGVPVAMWFVWRHTWPSRHGHDGCGRRVLVAASGGITTTFLTDVTAVMSVRTVVSSGRGRRFKTEGAPHSPPLTLSLSLLPSSPPLELPCGFPPIRRARGARAEEVSSRSCRGRARGAWSEEEVVIPT
ncbi:hypothetical protein Taro_041607 [Colocasia esculenta]|uniref:Uncharacterized protein n=1 Tax=Colocasia esculenta TaxID=4460 RepID=A0A843WQD4_COLES|nr:hypothetical protein [Colocasia esculenta]